MGLTYREAGRRKQWTNNTSTAVPVGGAIVELEDRIGIAINAIAIGATGVLEMEEVFELPATVAEIWLDGQQLYFVTATGFISNIAGANTPAGYAYGAKAAGVANSDVKINA